MSIRRIAVVFLSFILALGTAEPLSGQTLDSVWTIRGGSYAGVTSPIGKGAATRKTGRFWRLSSRKDGSRIVGWNPSRLPAGVAFRHGGRISAADSTAFWAILRQMEADMGMHLFEPATLSGGSDPADVIIVDTRSMGADDGVTFITWAASGAPYDARVFFRSGGTLHSARVVTHEMMHALGFGHTSAWSSVMSPNPSAPARLTLEDVAYAQAAFASREESERSDMWERLALAVERETEPTLLRGGYGTCPAFSEDPEDADDMMKLRGAAVLGVVTALGACSGGANKGPDTIAVPAAAIDTTTDRNPGNTPRATAAPATGVDTPITRKIGSPAPVKR
jgi:hypothetical protein